MKNASQFLHREGLAGRRSAGIHDDGPAAAVGLGLGTHALERDVSAGEIELLAVGPDQLDGVDPFLRVVVARLVIALLDAEHLEFILVPADDDVQPEPPFADVVGGHHLLGGDDGME